MNYWKPSLLALLGLSVLVLAGCSQTQNAPDGKPGPTAGDKAAAAAAQRNAGAQGAAAQAAAAQRAAGQKAAAQGSAAPAASTPGK